ncbi:hypothetical protein AB0P21_25020 [Kribbella sp. NPDC056861]|uniref:hypothetical protein n=1 Tax=Kribbella sp. NPDC056861 TaxID=3154857 RepID=UPI00343162CB
MKRNIKLAGLVAGVSLAAVVAGALVAAQQTPTLASASGDGVRPMDSVSKPAGTTPSTTPSRPPGTTPTASTTPSAPSGPVKLKLDLTKLRQGAAPATAYVDGRTVHLGKTNFTLPAADGPVWDVVRSGADSALVLHSPKDDGRAVLTTWSGGSRGETVNDVSSVLASADRTTSAYAVQPTNAEGTELPRFTLTWRDPSGEKYSLQRAGEHGPIIHAVQGSEVYFSALSKTSKQTLYRWTAGDAAPTPINAVPSPSAVSSDLKLAASIVSVADDGSCTALIELASAKKRWQTCTYAVDELRAKGDFALGGPAYRDGYGDGLFAALDVKTGKAVREWSGGSAVAIISTTLEDADHILVLAEQGGKTALARCAPRTGNCELAAPLKNGTGDENNRPYQLGH